MGSSPNPRWLSTKEAARYLGIHPDTLRRLRREGRGPRYVQPASRIIRYSIEALDDWLAGGEAQNCRAGRP